MNEKIRALAEQARAWVNDPDNVAPVSAYIFYKDMYDKKFAELIVAECIGVVEGGRFLHDQAPTALFAKECSGAIKRHFGVKE